MNAREAFWAGDFGREYAERSPGNEDANFWMFKRILMGFDLASIVELGAGTGANLRALARLRPGAELGAVELNVEACNHLHEVASEVHAISVLDWKPARQWDLALTKGFLIHIAPEDLERAYASLVAASRRYILICEYYNPTPVEVLYRGHAGRLWKRDFAGELMARYPLSLIDYGFVYHRGPHPQDDLSWFLMEKTDPRRSPCSAVLAA